MSPPGVPEIKLEILVNEVTRQVKVKNTSVVQMRATLGAVGFRY